MEVDLEEMEFKKRIVDKVGWLVMQYKISPTNVLWSPKDGLTIWLWKKDVVGWSKLSTKVLNRIPFHLIWSIDDLRAGEKERFISSRISKYTTWTYIKKLNYIYIYIYKPYLGHGFFPIGCPYAIRYYPTNAIIIKING
jgi:hypothetical protein